MAAGMSLEKKHYPAFSQAFDLEVRRQLTEDDLQAVLHSDGELQHKMPFTLEIDWDEVVTSLKKIGYNALVALDGGGDGNASPEELDEKLIAVEKLFQPLFDK